MGEKEVETGEREGEMVGKREEEGLREGGGGRKEEGDREGSSFHTCTYTYTCVCVLLGCCQLSSSGSWVQSFPACGLSSLCLIHEC